MAFRKIAKMSRVICLLITDLEHLIQCLYSKKVQMRHLENLEKGWATLGLRLVKVSWLTSTKQAFDSEIYRWTSGQRNKATQMEIQYGNAYELCRIHLIFHFELHVSKRHKSGPLLPHCFVSIRMILKKYCDTT